MLEAFVSSVLRDIPTTVVPVISPQSFEWDYDHFGHTSVAAFTSPFFRRLEQSLAAPDFLPGHQGLDLLPCQKKPAKWSNERHLLGHGRAPEVDHLQGKPNFKTHGGGWLFVKARLSSPPQDPAEHLGDIWRRVVVLRKSSA